MCRSKLYCKVSAVLLRPPVAVSTRWVHPQKLSWLSYQFGWREVIFRNTHDSFFPIGGHNLHQCHPFLSGKGHHCGKILKISFNYQIFRMHRFLKHFQHVGIQIWGAFLWKKSLRIYCNVNFCFNLSTFEHHNLNLPSLIPNSFTICKSPNLL